MAAGRTDTASPGTQEAATSQKSGKGFAGPSWGHQPQGGDTTQGDAQHGCPRAWQGGTQLQVPAGPKGDPVPRKRGLSCI